MIGHWDDESESSNHSSMRPETYTAFTDEMEKIAGISSMWNKFLDLFRSDQTKDQNKVKAHLSADPSSGKWDRFEQNAGSKGFINALERNPSVDPDLKAHAKGLFDLNNGRTVAKIKSSGGLGKVYEVKKLRGGNYGCTCGDWKYRGASNPGYACKHIKAFKKGRDSA